MALTPLSFSGAPRLQSLNSTGQNQNASSRAENTDPKVTNIGDSIQLIKDSSLLYQLVSRLLLSPDQDEQLADTLKQTEASEQSIETSQLREEQLGTQALQANRASSENQLFSFELSITVAVVQIEQRSFRINAQENTVSQSSTSISATSISIQVSFSVSLQFGQVEEADPIILDLEGNGFTTSGIESGALFDINADGVLDQVSITTNDDQFLALDVNHNGKIDDGSELFGDQTGFSNGFTYLASFDENQDGIIDKNDSIFNSLLMLKLVGSEQFITELSSTNIKAIDLKYSEVNTNTASGDRIVQLGDYKKSNGQKGAVADLMLQYKSGLTS